MRASTDQVLDVWTKLEDAKQGVSGYAGEVTEIYIYLLLKHAPALYVENWNNTDNYERAHKDFLEIFEDFAERRRCTLLIETPNGWLSPREYFEANKPTHRIHVKVTPDD